MKKTVSVLLLILWLVAGAVDTRHASGSDGVLVAVFISAHGERLTARYDTGADTVTLDLPNGTALTLPAAISGSGSRYSDGTMTFWEHQGRATLYRGEQVLFEGRDAAPASVDQAE